LPKLKRLGLGYNRIEDIGPLAVSRASGGLRFCSFIDLNMNPLGPTSVSLHLPYLRSQGIEVNFMTKADIENFAARLRSRSEADQA